MEHLHITIHRFDGTRASIRTYVLPMNRAATLLACLTDIQRHQDPTLNFTASCRSAVCGACAIRVNGVPLLACDTTVGQALELTCATTLELQPLANMRVVSDLVVDWEPTLAQLQTTKLERRHHPVDPPDTGCRQSPEEQERIEPLWDCMLCGACASACQKLGAGDTDPFLPPFAYTHACRTLLDSRVLPDTELMRRLMTHGLWRCLHCAACLNVCPKALKCGDHVAVLRELAAKAGLYDETGYRHGRAFVQDWEETGRLNEVKLNLRTEGWLGSMRQGPLALRLWRHGKLDPLELLGGKKIPGHEALQHLIASVRQGRK